MEGSLVEEVEEVVVGVYVEEEAGEGVKVVSVLVRDSVVVENVVREEVESDCET